MVGQQLLRNLILASMTVSLLGGCRPPVSDTVDDAGADGDVEPDDAGDQDVGPDADETEPPPDDAGPDAEDDEICTDAIDLVFVLDVSSSMGFVLQQLQSQIGEVVDAANELAEDSHFGLVAFVDNYAIDDTGDLEDGLVHTQATTLQEAFRHYRETYTVPNRNPGDGPDGPTTQNPICEENALDALWAAAADFPWRDNATRVIIVATDDTFLERPDNYGDRDGDGETNLTNFPREGDYPALYTVPEAITELQDARVRVFSFSRVRVPGLLDPSRCGTGRRLPWNAITDGWTTQYGSNPPIPEATDARNFDIGLVRNGSLSLVATINEVVVDSYCNEPLY